MQDYITKNNAKTSQNFGKDPYQRTIKELLKTGSIILDKHIGPTSHQVVEQLKNVLKIQKAGHSGTLDPKVTGVLTIGLGKGTKLMEYLLKSGKEYICLMRFHKDFNKKKLKETIENNFTGKIKQTPPIISSVKRVEREREIYEFEILETKDQFLLFRTYVQHGTYIRKLCNDIGEKLGIKSQMIELRRTNAGGFTENESISLSKLQDLIQLYEELKTQNKTENLLTVENELKRHIKPMEYLLKNTKKIYVLDSAVNSLCFGGNLAIPGISKFDSQIKMGDEIAIMTLKNELISTGISLMNSEEIKTKKKGIVVDTNKVFMEQNTYLTKWITKKTKQTPKN